VLPRKGINTFCDRNLIIQSVAILCRKCCKTRLRASVNSKSFPEYYSRTPVRKRVGRGWKGKGREGAIEEETESEG
jgi:hypothetical protein